MADTGGPRAITKQAAKGLIINMACEGPYCVNCGDCLHCFGEDCCLRSNDGRHDPEGAQRHTRRYTCMQNHTFSTVEDLRNCLCPVCLGPVKRVDEASLGLVLVGKDGPD